MSIFEFTPTTSPAEYVLFGFMTVNLLLSALILVLRGVQKLKPAKAK